MVYKALNIVVTSLAERGGKIESVLVKRSEGDFFSPNLQPAFWNVQASEANELIGFDLTPRSSQIVCRGCALEHGRRAQR